MKQLFFIVIFLSNLTTFSLKAQHSCSEDVHPDAVNDDFQQRLEFKKLKAKNENIDGNLQTTNFQATSYSSSYSNPNIVFDVVAHIPFTYSLSQSQVHASLCNLNQKFAPIGVQFKISEFRYDGSGISTLALGSTNGDNSYLSSFDVPNKINLYFPTSFPTGGEASFPFNRTTSSGYTEYKSSRIIIRIDKLTAGNGNILPHEFGHFFGLYHTYQEKDGSNCSEQGDLVCDTPYDSGTRNSTCYFDSNCNWVNGGNCNMPASIPLGNNFMSRVVDQYANEWSNCPNFFTQGQYARMVESYYVYSSSFFNQFTHSNIPFPIAGSDVICSGTTYSISAQTGATSYSWRLMQDNGTFQSVLTTGGNSTSFTPSISTNFTGFVEVRVNYTNGSCLYATKKVSGVPSSSLLSVSGQGMTVTFSGLTLAPIYNGSLITSSPNSQGILQAEWQSLSSSVYVSQSGITATAYLSNGCVGGVANLRVRVKKCTDNNNWSDWKMFTVNVCSFSGFRFVYSPNPTSDVLAITAVPTEENKNLSLAAEIDFEAKLIDGDGKVAREGKNLNKEKKITLDVKALKEGTYYLHILHGKEIERHQILIGK